MFVDGDCDCFQLQGQATTEQQIDATQASVVRAGDAGQPFVRLPGATVERDLDGERPPFDQAVGDPWGDQRPVGKQRDEKTLLLCIDVNIKEVFPSEDLSACV